MTSQDEYTRRILDAIARRESVTQRSLARELGVALGLTNLLLKRLISKGYVKVASVRPNRLRYLITPAGLAEKARVSRAYLHNTVRLYTDTREHIRHNLETLAMQSLCIDGAERACRRIVFYGAGEVAEIGYVSLQSTPLRLVGVVDDFVRKDFFGLPVRPPSALTPTCIGSEPFDAVVIMSFRQADVIEARLAGRGFPEHRTFRLLRD